MLFNRRQTTRLVAFARVRGGKEFSAERALMWPSAFYGSFRSEWIYVEKQQKAVADDSMRRTV